VPFEQIAPERPEEFGPGLDPELMELVAATADMEMNETAAPLWGPASS
jgi:Mn-containing catalase